MCEKYKMTRKRLHFLMENSCTKPRSCLTERIDGTEQGQLGLPFCFLWLDFELPQMSIFVSSGLVALARKEVLAGHILEVRVLVFY